MAKNEYRREFIMFRQLSGEAAGGFARLEQYTLRASLQFTVTGFRKNSMDTLKAFIAAKDGGRYRFVDVGGLRVDSRGQAGTLFEFDPRFISGLPFEAYSAIGIIQVENGNVNVPLAGNLYKGARVDFAELVATAREWFEPVPEAKPEAYLEPEMPPEPFLELEPEVVSEVHIEPEPEITQEVFLELDPGIVPEVYAESEPEVTQEAFLELDAAIVPEEFTELEAEETFFELEPEAIPEEFIPESVIIAEAKLEPEAEPEVFPEPMPGVVPEFKDIEAVQTGVLFVEALKPEDEFLEEVTDPVPDIMMETMAPATPKTPVLSMPPETQEKRGITGLDWPGASSALKPLFEYNQEFKPFAVEGFRFVKVSLPQTSGLSYCGIGVKPSDGTAHTLCYAIPGTRAAFPPPGLEGYRYKAGENEGYWVVYQDALTGDTVDADEVEELS